MEQRRFGPTEYTVSAVGLGGMPMSLASRPPESESVKVIHAALAGGMTLIDTANVYCMDDSDIGHNERLIARALREWSGPRHEVLVATKGGLARPRGDWVVNGDPEFLRRSCEQSLVALGVEQIAVYQLHAVDDRVPLADSVGALAGLRQAGKIRHVGLSNVSVAQIEAAQRIVPIVSVQNRCNPHDTRAFKDGVIAKCEADGLAFLPYSPVGGWRDRNEIAVDMQLVGIGRRYQATAFEIAIAWLAQKSKLIFPIPGASKVKNAESSCRAGNLKLSPEEITELDRAFGLSD